MDLRETDLLGANIEKHWYYRSKGLAVARLLKGSNPSIVLDIGSGSGFFSEMLLSNTTVREAWCIDTNYTTDKDARIAGKPIYFRRSIDKTNADLVLLLDVLEHVEDDVGLLREYSKKAPQGAEFLISVPAFQLLWSDHDIFLEHKRRYRLKQIESVVQNANLEVMSGAYYFGIIFPLAAAFRVARRLLRQERGTAKSHLRQHNAFINRALSAICKAETSFFLHNRVAGLSALVLARKPAEQ
jgi:SAM-dependent methyltransferase